MFTAQELHSKGIFKVTQAHWQPESYIALDEKKPERYTVYGEGKVIHKRELQISYDNVLQRPVWVPFYQVEDVVMSENDPRYTGVIVEIDREKGLVFILWDYGVRAWSNIDYPELRPFTPRGTA
jgi:hypothetical protein